MINPKRWTSPPQRNEELLDFRYGILKSKETAIRLVQILPGAGASGVAIKLIDAFVTGSGRVQYDALSYTWGSGSRIKGLVCNGKRLYVTPTLFEALHRFRHPDDVVTLWIDQLCICQDRVKERNQQVQLMGKIFKNARKVVVWLGEDYDDSRAGMQLAHQLSQLAQSQQTRDIGLLGSNTHGLPRQGHRRWKALAAILRRPWFWRTWIVQEVVLNPSVELVLGQSSITWDGLEAVIGLLEGPQPRVWQLDPTMTASELPFSRINRIRLRHQRCILTPITSKDPFTGDSAQFFAEPEGSDLDLDDGDNDPELLDLLLMSRDLGATDPRDKIYALLGLGRHDVDPDYSMSPESVFTDFALQTIGTVTAMAAGRQAAGIEISSNDREVRRAMILISCAGRQNQALKLPSWVPDWTVNLASRPLVFGAAQRFQAGGSVLDTFDWHFETGLQLSGKLFDTVAVVGTAPLTTDMLASGEAHTAIASWWAEALTIALSRTVRSPGSTQKFDAFNYLCRDLSICRHGYYIGDPRGTRRQSLLDDFDVAADTSHSALQTLTLGPTRGRVMVLTATGWLGLAPLGTREGDVLFVVLGADVPYVLRPLGEQRAYEIVGEGYVQGIMGGEAARMEQLLVQEIMIR